jgi:hypothetical protein
MVEIPENQKATEADFLHAMKALDSHDKCTTGCGYGVIGSIP